MTSRSLLLLGCAAAALFAAVAADPPPASLLPPIPPPPPPRTNRPVVLVPPGEALPAVGSGQPGQAVVTRRAPTVSPGQPAPLRPPSSIARFPAGGYAPPVADPTAIPGLAPSSILAPAQVTPLRSAAVTPIRTQPQTPENVLAWDGLVKEATLKPGETKATFSFSFTNTASKEVTIQSVRTSCGCTTAKVPPMPWRLPPGTNGSFEVVADLRGKSGVVTKTVTVVTDAGYRYLTVRTAIPNSGGGAMAAAERARNLQLALANRQAVLKGDCAVCHVTPGIGKVGEDLYEAVCGVCHEAEHRASMVPDLRALSKPMTADDWRNVITKGKPDSLMPAFAIREGGPLTPEQIESLVQFLTGPFKEAAPGLEHVGPRNTARGSNPPAE